MCAESLQRLDSDPQTNPKRGVPKDMAEIQSRFRLPTAPDISLYVTKIEPYFGGVADLLKGYDWARELRTTIEEIQTPWLEISRELRSFQNLVELQAICHALESLSAFDSALVKALRADLGDWRDAIASKPELWMDAAARSSFYQSVGFNRALTELPRPAFKQSLDVAGISDTAPTLVVLYGDPVPAVEDIQDRMVLPNTAYNWLFKF